MDQCNREDGINDTADQAGCTTHGSSLICGTGQHAEQLLLLLMVALSSLSWLPF